MTELVHALALPPGLHLVLLVLACLLLPVARRLAYGLLGAGVVSLYLLAIAPVGVGLIGTVEDTPALANPPAVNGEGAIVVLGGGRYHGAPEYGHRDTAGHHALMRLRYADRLREQTGLPVLTSGGRPGGEADAEADLMDRTLREAFEGLARWTEPASRNTFENAVCSRFILDGQGIERIFLVTHAAHMPRALFAFRKAGLKVTPAPTGYLKDTFEHAGAVETWLPSMEAFRLSHTALHEWLGLLYYRMVYGAAETAAGVPARC